MFSIIERTLKNTAIRGGEPLIRIEGMTSRRGGFLFLYHVLGPLARALKKS